MSHRLLLCPWHPRFGFISVNSIDFQTSIFFTTFVHGEMPIMPVQIIKLQFLFRIQDISSGCSSCSLGPRRLGSGIVIFFSLSFFFQGFFFFFSFPFFPFLFFSFFFFSQFKPTHKPRQTILGLSHLSDHAVRPFTMLEI